MIRTFLAAGALAATTTAALAQTYDERPAKLAPAVDADADFTRRAVEIPMRDGVKLHTVILVPKGAKDAGILLTRTPYNADELTGHAASGRLASAAGVECATSSFGASSAPSAAAR